MPDDLTESMVEALKKVKFGVFSRGGKFVDESGETINFNSLKALERRGLITFGRGEGENRSWGFNVKTTRRRVLEVFLTDKGKEELAKKEGSE